ncbi:MAG: hypothetical protein ACFBZ9_11505 [Sphingomonadales bacterium]
MTGLTLSLEPAPKLDVAVAGRVFARYPYWQPNLMPSTEVVAGPQAGRFTVGVIEIPISPSPDAVATWQRDAVTDVVLEFGPERLARQAHRQGRKQPRAD